MRKWFEMLLSGWVCTAVCACAPAQKQPQQDLKSIVDALGNGAEKAFLSGDVDSMLEYYTDDVISMPDGYPMIRGKANLKRSTQAILSSGLKFKSLESTPVDVQSDGQYVYEIGTYSQAVILPGTSGPKKSTGKYVTVWKRQPDGQLKIAVEIYNSDTGN